MTVRRAMYAASLDPITNGHINVIERMAPLYDKLIVVVAVDSRKTYTFTPEERVEMAVAAVAHLPNVTVDTCVGMYVVRMADELGVQTIVRGLRNFKDLEDEQTLAEENRRICPGIETVWVPCLPDLMHVSSSMVKGHVGVDPGWEKQVARSVPAAVVAKLKEKYILSKARKHWAALMATLVLGNPNRSEMVFKDLVARYGESHRAYHNLEHIVSMVEAFGYDHPEIALAIWFHDVVYDPRAKDNEKQSAELSKDAIKSLGLPDAMGERVHDLILATSHTVVPSDSDTRTLVDLDLRILAASEDEFDAYEAAIRQEYQWVSDADFAAGRVKVLQSFLDRPSIYSTHYCRLNFEGQARRNLERSIRRLQN